MQDLFRHLRIHARKKKMNEDEICYIHKIAYTKTIEEEPIPFYGIKRFVTYECPMCNTKVEEVHDKD